MSAFNEQPCKEYKRNQAEALADHILVLYYLASVLLVVVFVREIRIARPPPLPVERMYGRREQGGGDNQKDLLQI